MFVTFSAKLKKPVDSGSALANACMVCLPSLFFYLLLCFIVLAAAWCIYGVCWLCWLPFSLIFKNKKSAPPTSGAEKNTYFVFVTENGKCYHELPECAGNSNMKRIPLNQAKKKGLTPCSRCSNSDISAYING